MICRASRRAEEGTTDSSYNQEKRRMGDREDIK